MEILKSKLIRIGNSKGIRIPKAVLDRLNITEDIILQIDDQNHEIRISASNSPREGWEDAFKKMHESGDDELIIDDSLDLEPWDW